MDSRACETIVAHLAALSAWGIRRVALGAQPDIALGAQPGAATSSRAMSNGSPSPHARSGKEQGAPAIAVRERMPREEIARLLGACSEEVAACTRCGLSRSRSRTVFGTGDPCARLLFVGEAPGYDEDRAGEPFVGKAGQLLNKIIAAMGLKREEVYIANVVKCRPPENREPAPDEVACCTPFLVRQIRAIDPEVIVALGRPAANFLLGRTASLRSLRGIFHSFEGIPVAVTYHPAYLLRSPEDKKLTWQDMQRVMERLGLPRAQ